MPVTEAAAAARLAYCGWTDESPVWGAVAPGRVNLIGEHVDYNGGYVLPAGIELVTCVMAGPNRSPRIRLRTTAWEGVAVIDLDGPLEPAEPGWANYIRGVLQGFFELGITLPGFDAMVHSTIPPGGGLSSSAALEVAFATLLERVAGRELAPDQKALLCQRAEQIFAGVPCGIMDQFASVFARQDHLLLLDCEDQSLRWVPFTDPSVAILIFDTRVRHELASSQYARRRRSCEEAARALGVSSLRHARSDDLERARGVLSDEVSARARHVIGEIQRTVRAAEAIAESRWAELGELMFASHASLRDDYEVSCGELDWVVDQAGRTRGVIGCRMTGGGFGGCAVALVERDCIEAISADLASGYFRETGLQPSLFSTRPAQGARALDLSC